MLLPQALIELLDVIDADNRSDGPRVAHADRLTDHVARLMR